MTPRLREVRLDETPALAAARRLDPDARLPAFLDLPPGRARGLGRDVDLLVVGAGSVGMTAIDALAHLGLRSLVIVDPGVLKLESLITHASISHRDIGRSKAQVAAERAKAASPRTRVLWFDGAFEALPAGVVAHASYIAVATDSVVTELHVAEAALQLGLPLAQGSLWGGGLIAQVRSLAASEDGSGPSLCCGLGSEEWAQADVGTVFSCTGSPAPERTWSPSSQPTRSVSPLCATTGSLLALEITCRLLGIGDSGESRELQLCGYTFATTVTPLRRRAACPMDHQRVKLLPERETLGTFTPREVLERSGDAETDPRRVTLTVPGRRYAQLAACACSVHEVLERFVAIGGSAGRCPRCEQERAAHPLHSFYEVPASAFGKRLDRSFASLGAPAPASVRVRGERGASLVFRSLPECGIPEELAG